MHNDHKDGTVDPAGARGGLRQGASDVAPSGSLWQGGLAGADAQRGAHSVATAEGSPWRAIYAVTATLLAAIAITSLAPHDRDLRTAAALLGTLAIVVPVASWVRLRGLPKRHRHA